MNQKEVNITLFISIDFSTDSTEELVSSYKDSRIIILPYGERFGNAANNFFRLIKEVKIDGFDYVGFSDQDDIWLENKLSRALSIINDTGAVAFSSDVIAFWPSGKERLVSKSQPQKKWDYLFESGGPGCTYLLDSKVAKEIRQFVNHNHDSIDKVWMHDWFIYAFVRSKNYKWTIDNKPLIRYRQHENNSVGINYGLSAFTYRVKKILNGDGLGQSLLIARLLDLDKTDFVKRWQNTRGGLCWLSMHALECRRTLIGQFLFFLACMLLCVMNVFNVFFKK